MLTFCYKTKLYRGPGYVWFPLHKVVVCFNTHFMPLCIPHNSITGNLLPSTSLSNKFNCHIIIPDLQD